MGNTATKNSKRSQSCTRDGLVPPDGAATKNEGPARKKARVHRASPMDEPPTKEGDLAPDQPKEPFQQHMEVMKVVLDICHPSNPSTKGAIGEAEEQASTADHWYSEYFWKARLVNDLVEARLRQAREEIDAEKDSIVKRAQEASDARIQEAQEALNEEKARLRQAREEIDAEKDSIVKRAQEASDARLPRPPPPPMYPRPLPPPPPPPRRLMEALNAEKARLRQAREEIDAEKDSIVKRAQEASDARLQEAQEALNAEKARFVLESNRMFQERLETEIRRVKEQAEKEKEVALEGSTKTVEETLAQVKSVKQTLEKEKELALAEQKKEAKKTLDARLKEAHAAFKLDKEQALRAAQEKSELALAEAKQEEARLDKRRQQAKLRTDKSFSFGGFPSTHLDKGPPFSFGSNKKI